jgi:hypothetical protein
MKTAKSSGNRRQIQQTLREWRGSDLAASERATALNTVMKNHGHLRALVAGPTFGRILQKEHQHMRPTSPNQPRTASHHRDNIVPPQVSCRRG